MLALRPMLGALLCYTMLAPLQSVEGSRKSLLFRAWPKMVTEDFFRINDQKLRIVFAEESHVARKAAAAPRAVQHPGEPGFRSDCIYDVQQPRVTWETSVDEDTQQPEYTSAQLELTVPYFPCEAFRVKTKNPKYGSFLPRTAVVEVIEEDGRYYAQSESKRVRWLVRDGESMELDPGEENDVAEVDMPRITTSDEFTAFFVNTTFEFLSSLDTLEGVADRQQYSTMPAETLEQLSKKLQAEGLDRPESQFTQLEMLLQEEHELMQLLPSGTSEASWTNKFSQDDWDLVRQKTSLDDRKALADGWTLLSKMVLASTANSTWGVNCLRRAVAWHPGFVPAYLETSTFLENLGYKNGSCQTMEKMLERVDPTEFRSGEMRSILTSNFPHCSVIIRMANLWENNILFRYIVAASVIVSFLHGLCVAIYFFHDKFRFCCPSKREEHEQQPSDHVKPSSKKSKRD